MTRLGAGQSEVRIPVGARGLSLLQNVQTGSEAHPVSSSMGATVLSPRIKRPKRAVNHSPPSSAEVRKSGAIP